MSVCLIFVENGITFLVIVMKKYWKFQCGQRVKGRDDADSLMTHVDEDIHRKHTTG